MWKRQNEVFNTTLHTKYPRMDLRGSLSVIISNEIWEENGCVAITTLRVSKTTTISCVGNDPVRDTCVDKVSFCSISHSTRKPRSSFTWGVESRETVCIPMYNVPSEYLVGVHLLVCVRECKTCEELFRLKRNLKL